MLFYQFKKTDEITSEIEEYIKQNGELKDSMNKKADSVFVINEYDIAEKLCCVCGFADYLVGHRPDFKYPDAMVYIFKKDEKIYNQFQKLKGWIK